jgi:hypothetical protein
MSSGGGGGGSAPANTTNVQTIREAPEIEARRLGLMDEAKRVAAQPLNLPAFQTAGLTTEQQAAAALAGQTGVGIPSITGAQTAAGQYGTGATQAAALDPSSTQFQQYLNPYQSYIIDEINRQAAIGQQATAAQAIQSGAFGGGREGIQLAEQERARLGKIGESQEAAFRGALGAFQQNQALQAQTQLGAGQLETQTGLSAADALMRGQAQDITALGQVGATAQATEQTRLDAARQTTERGIQDPYTRLSFISDIQRGVPSSQQSIGQTAAPTTSPAAQAIGTGLGAFAAFAGK